MSKYTKVLDLKKYYHKYCEMAKSHGFPPMPIDKVDKLFGYEVDGELLYTCFAWSTDSIMAVLGFPVSNKEVSFEIKKGKLTLFMKDIVDYCKKDGAKIVWTTSGTDRVIESLVSSGFIEGDSSVNLYLNLID